MYKYLILLAGLILFAVLQESSCSSPTELEETIPEIRKQDGIIFKYVIIDGNKFIATETTHGFWVLTGPISNNVENKE